MSEAVFLVVPVYNEQAVIEATLRPLIASGYTLVVVDDGSSDATWAILGRLPVYRLRHHINLGQGAALQTGTSFAVQQGAAIIVHFDADGQHRPEDIADLVAPLRAGEADVVFGSRFLRRADRESVPPTRRLLLRGAIIVNRLLTGMRLTDAHNGLRALNRHAASQIVLRENRFAHASEILVQVRQRRLRYVERPTHIVYSAYSLGKGQKIWNSVNIVLDMLLRRVFG
jgi:glycosyltransferase involved in cell wall biosynthesis